MGFVGLHRASVGLQVPGVSILPLLLGERVQSGVTTSTIPILEPGEFTAFDLLFIDHGRRFVDFERPPRDS